MKALKNADTWSAEECKTTSFQEDLKHSCEILAGLQTSCIKEWAKNSISLFVGW